MIQKYLQNGELGLLGISNFDGWAGMFAQQAQAFEIDVDTSSYRLATRFSKFHNLPELTALFSQIADFHKLDKQNGIPDLDGYTDALIPKTTEFTAFLSDISRRADDVRAHNVSRATDNMLKITTDGRKGALDMRLVDPNAQFDYRSKVSRCAENVASIWATTNGSQLIFCDTSTPKAAFNVYDEMRRLLAGYGIPDGEIAYIHDAETETKSQKLFADVRSGAVRILIGSTFKLGIGVNVQDKLIALHHLDVPWRPADMTQREGRIIRQGNENESVLIYRYITEGSFDSYSWQILESKQRFISQFLAGSPYQRSVSDLEDNVLTYSEVKALALSEPLMKQLAETENEVKSLRIVVAKEEETIAKLKEEKKRCEEYDNTVRSRIGFSQYTLVRLERISKTERKIAAQNTAEILTPEFVAGKSDRKTVEFLCFTVSTDLSGTHKKPRVNLNCNSVEYSVEIGESSTGNARRLLNFVNAFDKEIEKMQRSMTDNLLRIGAIGDALRKTDSSNSSLLIAKEAELERLKGLVRENMNDEGKRLV